MAHPHLYEIDLPRGSTRQVKFALLQRHLARVEATRRARAADLARLSAAPDPSPRLLDALLAVANVRCEDTSERRFTSASPVHDELLRSPSVQEFLVDYARHDGQVDFAAYPAVLARCSPVVDATSDDPDDGLRGRARPYCRVLEATKHQHCLWSEAFQAEFPMSAIEEPSFRGSLEHLSDAHLVRRTYGGLTFRTSALGRALEHDRASATKLTNFNKVNGLHHTHYVLYEFIVDHARFTWSAPSAALRDTRRLALPSDFEALLVALAGPQGLNSASGGFSPRRVPDQELVDLRRAVRTRIAALAPPPPSDARSDHHEKLFQATLALQRELSSHLEADAANSDSLALVARSDEHLHDVATIASSLALGSRGEPLVGHILDNIPLTEFRGDPLVDFFGPGPAGTGTLHRSATGFAHGIDLVDPLPVDTNSSDPEQRRKVLEQLVKTNCGFLDLLPVADHDRYPDCLVFLQEHLVAVCPAPVLVLVGASVGSVFLQHRAPIRKTRFDPSLETRVAEEWLRRRPAERDGLPTWKALPMHGFSEVLGESIVVCVDEARDEWRLVIPQLHPGLNAYDPLLGVFRGRLAAAIELKAMLAEEVLRRWPVAGGNQDAIVGLRTRLQELSAECGLEHALETMRSRVLDMGAMVMGERYAGKTKVVTAAGAAAVSASTRRTNDKLPKIEGVPNGSRRRTQLKKIEELETEEVRRGVPVVLRSTPAYKSARPGTEIYRNFFLSLRPDIRYARASYGASGWAAQLEKMTTPEDLARYAANRKRVGELNAERQTGQQWVGQVTSPHLGPVQLMVLLADSTRPRIERKKDGYYWARHKECGWEGLAYYRSVHRCSTTDPVPQLSTKKGEGDNRHQVIAKMNKDAYCLRQLMYAHDVLDRVELDAGECEELDSVGLVAVEAVDVLAVVPAYLEALGLRLPHTDTEIGKIFVHAEEYEPKNPSPWIVHQAMDRLLASLVGAPETVYGPAELERSSTSVYDDGVWATQHAVTIIKTASKALETGRDQMLKLFWCRGQGLERKSSGHVCRQVSFLSGTNTHTAKGHDRENAHGFQGAVPGAHDCWDSLEFTSFLELPRAAIQLVHASTWAGFLKGTRAGYSAYENAFKKHGDKAHPVTWIRRDDEDTSPRRKRRKT